MQTTHHFQITDTATMPYLLYLPDDYDHDTSKRWPFILFLHGSGERGNDPNIIRLHGLPRQIDTQPDFPFIVLSPQCPLDTRWHHHSETVKLLMEAVIADLRVDHSRIYLTGLSMGGQGSWHLGSLYPERFAALLPICGRIPEADGFPEAVCALKDVPIWVFHGAKDDRVPVEHAERMVNILHDCGGDVKLTVFPDADHYCWDLVYGDQAIWQWLQAQQR
jgi:predicted peptidase